MSTEALATQITALVDNLRTRREQTIGLSEVAAVTEVLLGTMRNYFKQIDTSIYREFRSLSEYIEKARVEIAQLRPNELKADRLPRAGKELEAIVKSTEEATNSIMAAAEEIVGADASDPEAYKATVDDAVVRIFEACSFQDITGQRITKVVETLTYIEDRLTRLKEAWGDDVADAESETSEEDLAKGRHLLNGPQLEGEGVSQSEIDAMLADVATPKAGAKADQSAIDALFD
jgi:chemotaxis protein CheZ